MCKLTYMSNNLTRLLILTLISSSISSAALAQTQAAAPLLTPQIPQADLVPIEDLPPSNSSPLKLTPGQPLTVGTDGLDINPTDDVNLARQQVAAYPDNAEAAFILAVALTRTSRVEQALKEVRRAKKLAEAQGGPAYFDKMIARYEEMLRFYPEDNKVRYGLAWAYYMKAYLLSDESRRMARNLQPPQPKASKNADLLMKGLGILGALAFSQPPPASSIPHIQGALERATPEYVPQIRRYYELSLQKLDELIARNPKDVWARAYRAHLKAEYTGNLQEAVQSWKLCQKMEPNNPAAYFFLSDASIRQGNLQGGLENITKALQLRAQGQ